MPEKHLFASQVVELTTQLFSLFEEKFPEIENPGAFVVALLSVVAQVGRDIGMNKEEVTKILLNHPFWEPTEDD